MFENEMLTRAAICGSGILLAILFLGAHLPLLLLVLPVAILFMGVVADPYETHAVWYGMLNTLGIFDITALTPEETTNYTIKRHYFWLGEVLMAAALAGAIAVPAGMYFATINEATLAITAAAVIFLLLFVFMPKLIRSAMQADTDAVIAAFGKNEQVRKVFWTIFLALAGGVVAKVLDPALAANVLAVLVGT
jgi:hypothetical protein